MPDMPANHTPKPVRARLARLAASRSHHFPFPSPSPTRSPRRRVRKAFGKTLGLQLHDLLFFRLRDVVDARDVLVGEVLDLLLALLALVLGDLLFLLRVL